MRRSMEFCVMFRSCFAFRLHTLIALLTVIDFSYFIVDNLKRGELYAMPKETGNATHVNSVIDLGVSRLSLRNIIPRKDKDLMITSVL